MIEGRFDGDGNMKYKKWRFREDIVFQYINGVSSSTFQDAEDRLNYLEEKEQLPDMREKVKEYISELDAEIDRCTKLVEDKMKELKDSNLIASYVKGVEYVRTETRLQILTEVKTDLKGRLDELI